MPKPGTKGALLEEIHAEREKLENLIEPLTPEERAKPGAPGEWSVKDTLAHLAEWEQLLLVWHKAGVRGEIPPLPAEGYTWGRMDDLNAAIFEKYRDWTLEDVLAYSRSSYQQVLDTVQEMSEDELFTPGRFAWTKKNRLVDYVIPCTSEHYAWARKAMRKALKRAK